MVIEIPKRVEDLPTSNPRWVGHRVERKEDSALLTGRTQFIADVVVPGMLHCAILRSPLPHARIAKLDTTDAAALPGVVAVVTGEDALRWSQPAASAPEGWGTHCLASSVVRYVGEPVAAVAATSRYVAEDALERIVVDYDPLDAVADPFAAMEAGSPLVIEEKGTNVMMQRLFTWGAVDDAFAQAAHVFT
ncbi:MAG: xanthine dehydrogenase family protein molybdopterin-binding subunit, partial [Myxococcota bacterium]|nr:xanthine dehydrogenase family protein molybdopterin-binding subunit [Myxococcota bacterium]